MVKFVARRFIFLFITMFIVSVAVFLFTEAAPGNVARNVLGIHITPDQEESFIRQMGLDRPLYQRYFFWLVGSDWYANSHLREGLSVRMIRTEDGFREWWGEKPDGALLQWRMEGDDLVARERQPDGSYIEYEDNERWVARPDGSEEFWGVDRRGSVVRWERGTDREVWTLRAGGWVVATGGPVAYIPLQQGLTRGDPGLSLRTGRPVADTIFTRVRNTVILAGIAFVVVMPLALLLGLVAGINEGKPLDRFLSTTGLMFAVTPEFATGIFLILIFAHWLALVPGATVFGAQAPWERPEMLILPVLTLTLIELGYVLRITRASMVEVMKSHYIRTAVLKGLSYRMIVFKHALRNALIAPITVIMLHVNWLVGGIVIVETIFGYPGLGKYILDSALYLDVNAVQAGAMILVLVAVGTQLVADIAYTFLNPRIRYS